MTTPSTTDYVRFHARNTPRAIALIDGERGIDYATFHADLCRFTRAVGALGLPRRSFAAVSSDNLYVHWLTLLACENAGVGTISFLRQEQDSLAQLLPHVSIVLCGPEVKIAAKTRVQRLTKEWLAGVFASPAEDAPTPAMLRLDDPQRMRRSSGTTGGHKLMVATRGAEEHRVWNHHASLGITPRSRLLVSTPFSVGSVYAYATACLRSGAASIGAGQDLAREIQRHRPTHVRLFQFQVKPLIDALPAGYRRPADLTVIMGAAPLSDALRREIGERLATRLVYLYSVSEVGTVAAIGADGLGTLRPGVEAQVVDARGGPLPPGQLGRLKVKTATMVEGYLGNPAGTANAFRDGWFLTSDEAMLLPSGYLKLIGRSDDVLNIGGRKIAPAAIEAAVARSGLVADVGVTSIPNNKGIEEICIAVVLKERAGARESLVRIGSALPRGFGRTRVLEAARIPRTPDTGRIRRGELKKLFAAT